jgi:adenylate kinase
MILIFFGPPGAGKGTQANLISRKFKIPHLSTGDILRKKLLEKDPLSEKLQAVMVSGNLVSDEILNQLIANRLEFKDCINGFVLDGYPRTLSQNEFLIKYLEDNKLNISKIFDLFIDAKIVVNRIKSRSNIENRQDDRDDIIKTRISKYIEETKPLSDFYRDNFKKKYHSIDGNQEIEMIRLDILKIAEN